MALTVSHRQVDRLVRDLKNVPNGARRAAANAINEALKTVRKKAPVIIRKAYTIKGKSAGYPIKRSMEIKAAVAKASRLQGRLISKGAPLALDKFAYTRQTKKGVAVRVHRDQGKKLIPSGFFGQRIRTSWMSGSTRSGAQYLGKKSGGVWIRKRYRDLRIWNLDKVRTGTAHKAYMNTLVKGGTFERVPRLPIEQIFGPSAPAMLDGKRVRKRVDMLASEALEREIDYRINRLLIGKRK